MRIETLTQIKQRINLLFFVILLMFLSASCSEMSSKGKIIDKESAIATPTSKKTIAPHIPKPLMWDRFKEVIYIGLATTMYYNENKAFDDFNGSSWMIYRNETILPEGIEQIENNPLIPAELVQSLKNENDRTETLPKYTGDEDLIKSYPGDRDLSKFFDQAKRKFNKLSGTEKVAAFSRIGFSADHLKALVYAEYYSPIKKLIKCYFVMDIEMFEPNSEEDQAAQIRNVKMIPVN